MVGFNSLKYFAVRYATATYNTIISEQKNIRWSVLIVSRRYITYVLLLYCCIVVRCYLSPRFLLGPPPPFINFEKV